MDTYEDRLFIQFDSKRQWNIQYKHPLDWYFIHRREIILDVDEVSDHILNLLLH